MISEKWEHVKELFEAALEQAPNARKLFLSQLYQENPLVAEQVAELISSFEQAGDFLNQPCTLDSEFFEDLELERQRFSPGDILCNRFRVVRLLGKGGMGEVYEAWDEELESPVALKVLRLEVSAHDIFIARFRREIQLARKVTHPNICRIFDSFKHQLGNGAYITVLSMELLQGQTLAQYLQDNGRLTAQQAFPVVIQIAEGINAIHLAGIIHRDLKPSNVILVPDKTGYLLKITDFGIAGHLSPEESHISLTSPGGILGTPDYMAPEQLENGRTSVQSDIYSFGLILYEMVTGVKPFADGTAWQRLHQDPYPPRKIAINLPNKWDRVIRCCLDRTPRYRFQTALQIAASLSTEARPRIPAKPLLTRMLAATRSKIGIFAGILFFLALFAAVMRYFNQSPEIPSGSKVLVTEITNKTRNPIFSGITIALKSQLAQSAHFETEDGKEIKQMLNEARRTQYDPVDATTIREIARTRGDSLIIFGSLSESNQQFVLSISLERTIQNRTSSSRHWQRDFLANNSNHILENVRIAANWIRSIAGESAAALALQDRPAEDITTSSWHALQLLGEADSKALQDDPEAGILLLRDAIHEDPDFALAHMHLADILVSTRHYSEGYAEWQHAIDLTSKRALTSRENLRIKGQYFEDTWDYNREEQTYHDYTLHYPHDYVAWFLWGSSLDAKDLKEGAIQAFLKASEINSSWYGIPEHLAMLYLLTARFQEAKLQIAKTRSLNGTESAAWLQATMEFLQSDFQSALNHIEILALSPLTEWKTRYFIDKASFLAELGRDNEAISVLEQGIAFDKSHGMIPAEAEAEVALAYLYCQRRNFTACRRAALKASSLDPSPFRLVQTGTILARMKRSGDARKALKLLQLQPDTPLARMTINRISGEIDLAQGKNDSALKHLKAAAVLAKPREHQEYLAHALRLSGNNFDSRELLRQIIDQPARWWMYSDSRLPGFWADALFVYLKTAPVTQKDWCPHAAKYLEVRKMPDSLAQSENLLAIQSLYNSFCELNAN